MTTPPATQAHDRIAESICQTVAEIPDRSSPDDAPDMMLVTADELHTIVVCALENEAERQAHSLPGDVGTRAAQIADLIVSPDTAANDIQRQAYWHVAHEAAKLALGVPEDDPACTDCGDTGVTYQTESPCSCRAALTPSALSGGDYAEAFDILIDVQSALVLTADHSQGATVASFVSSSTQYERLNRFLHERQHADPRSPSALSGEHCNRCGHNNPSWSAPSPLWNAVMRGGSIDGEPTFDDMVCASCFTELAEQQGIASGWTVKADKVNVPLETTTPSGRVWDDDKGLWVSALSGDAGEGEASDPDLDRHIFAWFNDRDCDEMRACLEAFDASHQGAGE